MRTLQLLLGIMLALPALARWPVWRVLQKQFYFSGVQALPLILFIGAAVGGIVAGQLHYGIGQSGEGVLQILASITLRELAPLLTAIIITARSASAMASELALMRAHGELAALERMGMSVLDYLIMPRVIGMLLASLCLSIYFSLAALLTGAVSVAGLAWVNALQHLTEVLSMQALWVGMFKSMVFGVVLATVACRRGLAARGGGNEVPIAASQAVIRALLLLFAIDLLFIVVGWL